MHTRRNSPGPFRRYQRTRLSLVVLLIISAAVSTRAEDTARPAAGASALDRFAGHEQLLAETHAASLKLREAALRRTIARDSAWPHGVWGDTLWTLAALHLNEKVDEANARLLRRAREYIALKRGNNPGSAFTPEEANDMPWAYFSLPDYVRILYLFHAKSRYFPGRLYPETEAAMKEALWFWASADSRVADAGLDDLFLLLGTENHDLTRRPNHYLVTAFLSDDPAYRDRRLADGQTTAEHAVAYTAFFRQWPCSRARTGLWVEIGSNTYQKYSWPALFNLHELAPDPVVRHRFGLLLDQACIEEAQISVQGRRGGGRSRAENGPHGFESYKNLLYGWEGRSAGSSHSRVIETSRYQVPAEAILLAKRAFPATERFVIRNRVLGELEALRADDSEGQRLAADSALVNYAYRTPAYLLGSTLQNPALAMRDPATGDLSLKYAGISRQKRTCGLLFDDPSAGSVSQIYPVAEQTGGGRSQHSFWSVQHENVFVVQRIARHGRSTLGSYNTGKLGMRFEGDGLSKIEEDGWIFAGNGRAFAGVKFLDGGHQWDEEHVEADPASVTGPSDTTRILLHAGDAATHGSFDRFREMLRSNTLRVTAELVDYRFAAGTQRLEMSRYDSSAPETFVLPRINGAAVDLRPATAYESPFLNGTFGDERIRVTVGPVTRVLDFSAQGK